MGKIILEFLDHFGRVKERHRVESLPCTIGRGYENDIIIDDPYISPEHLVLDQDETGDFSLQDLNSTNGTYLLPSKQSIDHITLPLNSKIRLGHSTIRFRDRRQVVKETQVDRLRVSLFNELLTSKLFFMFFQLLFIGFLYLQGYQNSSGEIEHGKVFFSDIMPLLLGLAVWAGIWAIISRISSHYFYFITHMTIVTMAILADYIITIVFSYLRFAFSKELTFDVLEHSSGILIMAAMFFAHLRFSSMMQVRRVIIISLSISFALTTLILFNAYVDKQDFRSTATMSDSIKAPYFRLVPNIGLEEFLRESESLK